MPQRADDESLDQPRIAAKRAPIIVPAPDSSSDENSDGASDSVRVSRATQRQLDEDDAQIAALEKRLGRKRKTRDDGMASLFQDLDGVSDEEERPAPGKERDREAEEWLRRKRQKTKDDKTTNRSEDTEEEVYGSNSATDDDSELDAQSDFDDFSDAEEDEESSGAGVPVPRENPYVAPGSNSGAKYVPPSRRVEASPEDADQQRLRRQVQGLLNRLSESNIIDIVKQIGHLYTNHARHDVSRLIMDLLIDRLSDMTALNDTYIILHAGFIAALHKTIGMEFAAAILQRIVEEYDKQSKLPTEVAGKRPVNLALTLAELYNFQTISSVLIYDLVRGYIRSLTETDAELLLKIVRNSGFQLRQDDPGALKEISIMLQETVKRLGGEQSLNVRTRFMIETIDNLRNNRNKSSQGLAALNTEHVIRMKKTLASLQATSGITVRSTEPLRIGLIDIRDSDLKGKWWLVGASFRDADQIRAQTEAEPSKFSSTAKRSAAKGDSTDMAIDMASLARAFGMNTDIRKALFVTIMTAATVDEVKDRLIKMRLTKKQMREVPSVLVRCATAEKTFNPYYADLAKKLGHEREIRKALWNPLFEILNNLESNEHSEGDEEDEDQTLWWQAPQAKFNVAKFYGNLLGEGVVPITVLANRDLINPPEDVQTFLELMFVGMLYQIGKGQSKKLEAILRQIAGKDGSASLVPVLRNFFRKRVAKTVLVAPNEKKTVQWGCKKTDGILAELQRDS